MSSTAPLISQFKGDTVTPSDTDEYPLAIARFAGNAERRAKLVAFVRDAHDVVLAINYAKEHRLPIAIKGGGHNSAGASSVKDGLVIDLSRYLNKVTVDPEQRLAYVGGGALWDAVDRECIKYGLATVAGTVNNVRLYFYFYHILILFFFFRREWEGSF
jgi:FAD/FMN-containing dehydrogenase